MNETLWSRVQTALDERRDPLEDPAVRAWMLEHPDDALALVDLRAALGELERADNRLRAPRRPRLLPLAAAALALVALGAWLARPSLTAAEELALHPIVAAPQLGNVYSWGIVSTRETPESTQTVRASQSRVEIEDEDRTPSGVAGSALARATVVAMRQESWSPR